MQNPRTPSGRAVRAKLSTFKHRPTSGTDTPVPWMFFRVSGKVPGSRVGNSKQMSKPVFIGVDPAFRAGGFVAVIIDMTDRTASVKVFESLLHWHDWLRGPDAPAQAYVCVENSNLQNKTFDMSGGKPEVARVSRNAGANQAVSQLAFESAKKRYGNTVYEVSPRQKGRKITDARQFAAIAQHAGITLPKQKLSQDARDAFMLADMAMRFARMGGNYLKK